MGIPTVHPSRTTNQMSKSSSNSNTPAHPELIQLYRFVFADVLCRSARPSQVATQVSRTVRRNSAIQSRAVCTHHAEYHVTQPVIQSAA